MSDIRDDAEKCACKLLQEFSNTDRLRFGDSGIDEIRMLLRCAFLDGVTYQMRRQIAELEKNLANGGKAKS